MTEWNIKSNHHYVWRYYLEAWATEGRIACMRASGRPFRKAIKRIAAEDKFYRIHPLSESDFKFLRAGCQLLPNERLRDSMLRDLIRMLEFQESGRRIPLHDRVWRRRFDVYTCNFEEDLHGDVEQRFQRHLDALRLGDVSLFSDENSFANFARYIAAQFTRTKSFRDYTATIMPDKPGLSAERIWPFFNRLFAIHNGHGIATRRTSARVHLLCAPDGHEFITSDSPVVNIFGFTKAPGTEGQFDLYYPLCPTRALRVELPDEGEPAQVVRVAAPDEIHWYNVMMRSMSHEMAFATTYEALEGTPLPP